MIFVFIFILILNFFYCSQNSAPTARILPKFLTTGSNALFPVDILIFSVLQFPKAYKHYSLHTFSFAKEIK